LDNAEVIRAMSRTGERMIMNNENCDEVIEEIKRAEHVAFDTETVSLSDISLVALSIAYDDKVWFVPVTMTHFDNIDLSKLTDLLYTLREHKGLIMHNASFDMRVLREMGYWLDSAPDDTLLLSHLIDENTSHKLKDLAKEYLNITMLTFKEVCGVGKKQISFRDVSDKEIAERYASDDAKVTLQLYNLFLSMMSENTKKAYYEIEKPLILAVDSMHECGVPVDGSLLNKINAECVTLRDAYEEKLKHYMGDVNINSSKQLREYFIDKKRCAVLKRSRKTDEPSVNSEVLKKYAQKGVQEADWILKYRFYSKIVSTFITALTPDEEGKIHPSFHQVGTTSGRFSSSEPNFQNIPKRRDDKLGIRKCITAPKGYVFVGYDYSAIELRLAAHFSNEESLIKVFEEGRDIHSEVAKSVGCSRDQAKVVSYGLMYGMGINSLSKSMRTDRVTANKYMHNFRTNYPQLTTFMQEIKKEVVGNKKITMLYGREGHLPKYFEDLTEWDKGGCLRKMANAIIQGSAAMMMKKAMILIHEQIKDLDACIIASIHDELLVIVSEDNAKKVSEIVKNSMIKAGEGLRVPITVDGGIGKNWMEVH
jgi:DNA polymerase I